MIYLRCVDRDLGLHPSDLILEFFVTCNSCSASGSEVGKCICVLQTLSSMPIGLDLIVHDRRMSSSECLRYFYDGRRSRQLV